MSSDESPPEDTFSERAPGTRMKYWLLLEVDRTPLAAVILVVLFGALVVVGHFDPTPLSAALGSKDPIETAFQALVTGLITGVTLVVTINQLVLSQELGSAGDQRERMEGALSFRADAEDVLGVDASPADPSEFLTMLFDAIDRRAQAVGDIGGGDPDVDEYVTDVSRNANRSKAQVSGAEFGTYDVVSAALNFNYSWKIVRGRRLASDAGDELAAAIEDLEAALKLYGTTREHFKTLYFQWALIDLSRSMLYASLPALLVSLAMILFVDQPGTVVGRTLGVDNLLWIVAAGATLALAPFVLLLVYVLRIATISKHTLSIVPFILRSERGEERPGE